MSVELEAALLGAILLDNRQYARVAGRVAAKHFAADAHQRIFDAIARRLDDGLSADPLVLDLDLSDVGGQPYYGVLLKAGVLTRYAADYADAIARDWRKREARALFEQSTERLASDSVDDVIADAVRGIDALVDEGPSRSVMLGVAADEVAREADLAHRAGNVSEGLPTRLSALDAIIGGLERKALYVVGGRPGMGKSAFALALALNNAAARPLFFSAEMGYRQLARRALATEMRIAPSALKRGELDIDQWAGVPAAVAALDLPIEIDESTMLSEIVSRARLAKRRGCGLVIVDHLRRIRVPDSVASQGPTHATSEVSAAMKRLAKTLDIPVVLLAQLHRGLEGREDKRPTLSDFRQSGEIEEDADVALLLYRESYYLANSHPTRREGEDDERFMKRESQWYAARTAAADKAEIIVAKQRDGRTGVAKVRFDERLMTFGNIE